MLGPRLLLNSKLVSLKQKLTPQFLTFFFLRSLPSTPTWDVFRTAILNSTEKIEDLSFETVATRAASQVTNATSLSNSNDYGESALQTSQRCLVHGPGSHSTDDCIVAKRTLEEANVIRRNTGPSRSGNRTASKGKTGKGVKSKKGKETAKVAEERDSDSDSGHDPDDDGGTEYAAHVYISDELKKHFEAYVSMSDSQLSQKREETLFDSACSAHMTPNLHWLVPESVSRLSKPIAVHLGDDSILKGIARGTMRFRLNQNAKHFIEFKDVLLVPELATTLISIPALACSGLDTLFNRTGGHILYKWKPILTARYDKGLYRLTLKPETFEPQHSAFAAQSQPSHSFDINILHRRLGHASEQRIRRMVRKGQLSVVKTVVGKLHFCEPCVLGKMKKLPFRPKARRETSAPFELIHTDLGGPVTPQTPSGFRYWMVFIDDYTRFPFICFLRHKDEALGRIKHFYQEVQSYFKKRITHMRLGESFHQTLRSDGGGEFTGREVETYLKQQGIFHETSAPHTQEQNGVAERMNQSIRNSATAMLIDSGLPRTYWNEAMLTAVHVIARTPAAGLDGQTPFERMFNRPVDPTALRPFGCPAYALVPKKNRVGKFDQNSRKCILLGYQSGQKAYRLLDPKTRQIFSSRHVLFDETWKSGSPAPKAPGDTPDANSDWGELLWHQRPLSSEPGQASSLTGDDDDDDTPASDSHQPVGAPLIGNPQTCSQIPVGAPPT
ncbi:hypothetical protein NMY22_g18951 [Coprinellus aureogranulatus]|nr:hypothetical protein NMY22_g18951 [Coprinellus aureogranulatus]